MSQTECKLTGKRSYCSACGEYFSTVSNFDRHRRGPMTDRQCVDPASVGLVIGETAGGTFWKGKGRENADL